MVMKKIETIVGHVSIINVKWKWSNKASKTILTILALYITAIFPLFQQKHNTLWFVVPPADAVLAFIQRYLGHA